MMVKVLQFLVRNIIFLTKAKEISLLDRIRLKFQRNRFIPGTIRFTGKEIKFTDAPSFVSMYEEMFIHQVYKFKSQTSTPLVVDCGANVGLSVIYFKNLFPKAEIVAFEPDEKIFNVLSDNIKALNLQNVELHQKAIWKENTQLSFAIHSGLSGHIMSKKEKNHNITKVESFRLKDFLQKRKVDFLKIDIEGAEYEVLKDCTENLKTVENLFVEYHSLEYSEQKLDEILIIIKQAGFRYQIKEVFTSPLPFVALRTQEGMDLQLNIFCYRI